MLKKRLAIFLNNTAHKLGGYLQQYYLIGT